MKNEKTFVDIIKWGISGLLTIAVAILGVLYSNSFGEFNAPLVLSILISSLVLAIGEVIASIILSKRMKQRLNANSDKLQEDMLKNKAQARKTAEEKLPLLKNLIVAIDLVGILFVLCGCAMAFCYGASIAYSSEWASILIFPSILMILCGIQPLRRGAERINFKKNDSYVDESEYPELYRVANAARERIGCKGKIKISLTDDFNAGILKTTDAYSIVLGVMLLNDLSEAEFYNVLLHEFAHVTEDKDFHNYAMYYFGFITGDTFGTFGVTTLPYSYFSPLYTYEYIAYSYACSVINEEDADAAIIKYGDPATAASMLIKMKFSELYEWERVSYPEENLYESEEIREDHLHLNIEKYKSRVEVRRDEWIGMIDSEIIANNATHPTVKMRIEALGVGELEILPKNDSEKYLLEVERAVCRVESKITDQNRESYKEQRKRAYLDYLEVYDKWVEGGREVKADEYESVIIAMINLGKVDEIVNFCYQIIENIPEPANYYAHHILGCFMLHTYDERGIEHLYKSIEENHNMWQEAIDTIGRYCCIMGMEDRLEEYRARAKEILALDNELYSHMRVILPRDTLVTEELADGMLDKIIARAQEVGGDVFEKLYLVRKVIDDEKFVSCVVVKPLPKADIKKYNDAMDKMYQFLDKGFDWHFSLFDFYSVPHASVTKVKGSCVWENKAGRSKG